MEGYDQTVIVKGEERDYNAAAGMALLLCENCAAYNEVPVDVTDGVGSFAGFVCEKCGFYNAP